MRLIDADALREDWLENGLNERAYDTNDFLSSIDDAPTVEAFTTEEIEAAIKDRNALCATVRCDRCDYRELGCGLIAASRIGWLVQTYRKRKEAEE